MTKGVLRFAFVCAVAATATALHAAELFPIYQSYQKAIAQGDAAGAKFYLTAGRRAELSKLAGREALAEMDVISPKENLRLHEEILEDDDATLIVIANVAESESTGRIHFRREQGTWKILSEMWDLGGSPDSDGPTKVRQPQNEKEREALRKLREMGFPEPTADFLVMSAVQGNLEAVKLFVEAGYSVDTKSEDGSPAIVSAAMFGHPEVVDWLIDRGADVNASDGMTTALHRIADKCDATATIRKLIAKGAKTGLKTAGGATALQLAEWANCEENVAVLKGRKDR